MILQPHLPAMPGASQTSRDCCVRWLLWSPPAAEDGGMDASSSCRWSAVDRSAFAGFRFPQEGDHPGVRWYPASGCPIATLGLARRSRHRHRIPPASSARSTQDTIARSPRRHTAEDRPRARPAAEDRLRAPLGSRHERDAAALAGYSVSRSATGTRLHDLLDAGLRSTSSMYNRPAII